MRNRLKRFLVPSSENNFRPDFLERFSVGIMLVLILLSFSVANLQALLWISSDWLVSTILPSVLVELTNKERGEESLSKLTRNSALDAAAKLKAEDMAKNEYFSHYSPTGVSPWYWFDQSGYNYLNAGENLAVHFTESGEVVDAWMDSPSHRANILNGQYTEVGIGTARGEYNGYPTVFVVQLFGTPRAEASPGTVAGASKNDITIEKISVAPIETDVSPATIETQAPLAPAPSDVPGQTEEKTVVVGDGIPRESIVLMMNLATTSRSGTPAMRIDTGESSPELPITLRTTTDSRVWLTYLYGFLASLVVLSLCVSLALEWRRHHPVQMVYAGGLLTVMALLLYIHVSLTGVVVII